MPDISYTVPSDVAEAALAAFDSQALAEAAGVLDCDEAAAIAELLRHLGDEQAASYFTDQHQDECTNHTQT